MPKTIFVVDNNQQNLELFLAILNKIPNLKVFAEEDSLKAFKKIKEIQPDIIILDILLPKMSGIEICTKLREMEQFKETSIIAVTALATKNDKERIMEAGFNKFVSKPIKVKELRQLIMNIKDN